MSAVDRAARDRRDYDLTARLEDHVAAFAERARAAGWTEVLAEPAALSECALFAGADDVDLQPDEDLVAVRVLGLGRPGFLLTAAWGVSRRTGRVSALCDPDRHDARVVVHADDDSGRYWWSPRVAAIGAAIDDPARFTGADVEEVAG